MRRGFDAVLWCIFADSHCAKAKNEEEQHNTIAYESDKVARSKWKSGEKSDTNRSECVSHVFLYLGAHFGIDYGCMFLQRLKWFRSSRFHISRNPSKLHTCGTLARGLSCAMKQCKTEGGDMESKLAANWLIFWLCDVIESITSHCSPIYIALGIFMYISLSSC